MTAVAKLALFAVLLAAVFTGGLALGAAAGPFDAPSTATHGEHTR